MQGGVAGLEQDPLSLVGGPLAASTPTAAGSSQQPPMYHTTHLSTLPLPQYTCEAVPYTQAATPPYSREVAFMPIHSAYRQDLHSHSDVYASDMSCLPPPYPSYSLSLGRDGRLTSQQNPACLPTGPHPLGPPPDPDALGTPMNSPWEGSSDRSGSPSHRESSV